MTNWYLIDLKKYSENIVSFSYLKLLFKGVEMNNE